MLLDKWSTCSDTGAHEKDMERLTQRTSTMDWIMMEPSGTAGMMMKQSIKDEAMNFNMPTSHMRRSVLQSCTDMVCLLCKKHQSHVLKTKRSGHRCTTDRRPTSPILKLVPSNEEMMTPTSLQLE